MALVVTRETMETRVSTDIAAGWVLPAWMEPLDLLDQMDSLDQMDPLELPD
jgi:hypothetical protein